MTNKKLWQGTEACWRHSHNDVGDCGDDSFQTLTAPPPLVILLILPALKIPPKPKSCAQTGALLKFELSDMLFIVESVKMCALYV